MIFDLCIIRTKALQHYGDIYNDRPFEQETEGEGSIMNRGGQHFTYDGPIEGRKLYIYKWVNLIQMEITEDWFEACAYSSENHWWSRREGRRGTTNQYLGWGRIQGTSTHSNGHYRLIQSAQRHNLNVFHRIGNDVYAGKDCISTEIQKFNFRPNCPCEWRIRCINRWLLLIHIWSQPKMKSLVHISLLAK